MLLALLHPMLGLIFTIAISGRTLVADPRQQRIWVTGFVILAAGMYLLNVLPLLDVVDIVSGLALSLLVFAWALRRTGSWLHAILGGTAVQVAYALLRRWLFAEQYLRMVNTTRELMHQALGQSTTQLDPDRAQAMIDMIDQIAEYLLQFQEAFWVVPMLMGFYVGTLLLSKRVAFRWNHRTARLPHALVYPLIAGMAMVLVAPMRTAGWNVIAIFAWVYFIQGMMIIDFYWGKHFARSRVLTVILVLAIMLNYFVLGLIMVMGLLDTWFNFRKLPDMEEERGDNSHTGNL